MHQKTSLLTPVAILLLQSAALLNIFYILTTEHTYTDVNILKLTILAVFIAISSIFTFKLLSKLKNQEIEKEKSFTKLR